MLIVFVTGVSGSGKSTLARRLASWGHRTVSMDGDNRLCSWTDQAGRPATRPQAPDATWLSAHEWRWNRDRLDEIIAEAAAAGSEPLWLFGQAANAAEFTDRFDLTIQLEIDQQTMADRMRNGSRGNDFGKVGDSLAAALASYTPFVATWRRRGVIVIDATADVHGRRGAFDGRRDCHAAPSAAPGLARQIQRVALRHPQRRLGRRVRGDLAVCRYAHLGRAVWVMIGRWRVDAFPGP